MTTRRLFIIYVGVFLFKYFTFFDVGNAARILAIFPFPGKSAFYFNEAVVKSLHSAGHHITFLNPFPQKIHQENLTIIDSLDESKFVYVNKMRLDDISSWSLRKRLLILAEDDIKYCFHVFKLKIIKDILLSKVKYDALLTQVTFLPECYFKLAEQLRIPIIGTVAFKQEFPTIRIGNPSNPAVIPHKMSPFTQSMTFYERLENTWYYLVTQAVFSFELRPRLNEFYREHFPETPNPPKNTPDLVFLSGHPLLLPRPMVPNMIEVAGVHIQPAKPLRADIKKFIEEAEHGVILFSFGSVLKSSTMSASMKSAFTQAFASIPQRVIWKFEGTVENISENVFISNWIPQRDILEHKKVIAFISHCGLSGVLETIYTATPIITAPLFADQQSNAKILQDLNVAVHVDPMTATKDEIINALNTIVNDTRYLKRMKEISQIFKDRPISPQESVVYWTEYVIRHHGAPHLRTTGADMPFYQYLLLDVLLFIITFIVIILSAVYFMCSRFCRCIRQSRVMSTSLKKKKKE